MPPAVLWFRRDLWLGDHPALLAALGSAGSGERRVPLDRYDRIRGRAA